MYGREQGSGPLDQEPISLLSTHRRWSQERTADRRRGLHPQFPLLPMTGSSELGLDRRLEKTKGKTGREIEEHELEGGAW